MNALSSKLIIDITKNSKIYSQSYSQGKILNKLKTKGKSKFKSGTSVTFTPDKDIFGKEIQFDPEKVYEIAKNKSYLQKGVNIYWECNKSLLNRNSNISNKEIFQSDGLADFLKNETNQKNILHEKICYQSGDFSEKKVK